jgi:hypothetical protein
MEMKYENVSKDEVSEIRINLLLYIVLVSSDTLGMVWFGLIWLRICTSGGEHGNEPSGSIKCWEVPE